MKTLSEDTSPGTERTLIEAIRTMSPGDRLLRMRRECLRVDMLVLAGLRHRHPSESEPELARRLAKIRCGSALIDRWLGPRG